MSDDGKNSAGEDSAGEEEAYEVETIVGHKKVKGKWLYEVKWKGYSLEDTTWEPEDNLDGSQELLEDYRKERPDEFASKSAKRKRAKSGTPDDDDFSLDKVKPEPKAKKRKSAATVADSDSDDDLLKSPSKPKAPQDVLPAPDACLEVLGVGRPKKTPADVPAESIYFLTKFTKDRKLLVCADDVQKHYPKQLCAFLMKRAKFTEGAFDDAPATNGNGTHDPDSD